MAPTTTTTKLLRRLLKPRVKDRTVANTNMESPKVINVGILGANDLVQSTYLPLLQETLKPYFSISSIYTGNIHPSDPDSFQHIPQTPTASAVITSPSTSLIINALPLESREASTIAALAAGKYVLVDTPLTLSLPSARRILEAEKNAPNGARVFIGCARRFAPCFREVFLPELASLDRVYYARCRNIRGGVYPPTDMSWAAANANDVMNIYLTEIFDDQDASPEQSMLCRYLSENGCRDLSLMQETLGLPEAVSCVSVNHPFYSAVFHYTDSVSRGESQPQSQYQHYLDPTTASTTHPPNTANGYLRNEHPFTLTYEAANDSIPRNDSHFAIYGASKSIRMDFGISAIRVVVEETDEEGGLKTTESLSSWVDAYREEMRALYVAVVAESEDEGEVVGAKKGMGMSTAAKEGVSELKLARMVFRQYDRQCGTIRTPL